MMPVAVAGVDHTVAIASFVEDQLFSVLTGAGIALVALGVVEVAFRRWRKAHPPRQSPSRRDWKRIRAVEARVAAARVIARVKAENETSGIEDLPALAARVEARSEPRAVDRGPGDTGFPSPAAGWVRITSGSLW